MFPVVTLASGGIDVRLEHRQPVPLLLELVLLALRARSRPPSLMNVTMACSSPASRNVPWPRQTSMTVPESRPKFSGSSSCRSRRTGGSGPGAARRCRRVRVSQRCRTAACAPRGRRRCARNPPRRPRRRRTPRTRGAQTSPMRDAHHGAAAGRARRRRGLRRRPVAERAPHVGQNADPSNISAKQRGQLTVASRARQ